MKTMKYTIDQIQAATGDGLSKMAGEVLGNLPCATARNCTELPSKCGRTQYCTAPTPLTWPEAMKYFELMTIKHGRNKMIEAMKEVYLHVTGDKNGAAYVMDWWPFKAGIEGNLKAAMICKLRAEGGK